jgi:hypothetical protein
LVSMRPMLSTHRTPPAVLNSTPGMFREPTEASCLMFVCNSCTQIRVTSNGSQQLPGGTSFPGTYTDSTQGIKFNIYVSTYAMSERTKLTCVIRKTVTTPTLTGLQALLSGVVHLAETLASKLYVRAMFSRMYYLSRN